MARRKKKTTKKKTTAAKTTAAKKTAAKKKTTAAQKKLARRPEWSEVTYEQMEEWRKAQGLPKKRFANVIGVTNSTYHNWARGIAVATYNTQRKIRDIIEGRILPSADGRTAPARLGSRANGGGPTDVIGATADIVNTYQQTHAGKMSRADLLALIRDVRAVLAGS